LHVDTVFFSAKGFTQSSGFSDAHMPEVEAKEQLIATARQVVALLDHSKFGADAFSQIVPLERVHVVITDQEPSPEIQDAFKTANVRLIVTQEH
jgi:DeoR family transcriptional regulator, fructose operon transcriptional repressor